MPLKDPEARRAYSHNYSKRLRAERRSLGLCQCGNPRDSEFVNCKRCLESTQVRRKARQAAGMCINGCDARTVNKSFCAECNLKHNGKSKGYTLTLAEKELLETAQQKRCAICINDADLNVDHCHTSGRVRGLLCMTCNLLLGYANDDPKVLESAIAYLKRVA
jgi:hypothetical protein